jgi:hypothetical protein
MSPRTSEGITRVSRRRCAALANAPRQREPLSVRHAVLSSTTWWSLLVAAYPTIAQLAEPAESPRDMHWRRGTSIPGRAFARRNSSTNCPISHSPRPRRLIRGAVRDGGRPWSRIVAWIQPPCTPMVTWTGCASQDPYRMALVAASLLVPNPWLCSHQVWLAALPKRDDANTEQRNQRPVPAQASWIVGPVPSLSDAAPASIREA